jgi:hypothetical protein
LHSAALVGRISQTLREQVQDRVAERVQDLRNLELLKWNPMRCRPVDARTETPRTVVFLKSRLEADIAGIVDR